MAEPVVESLPVDRAVCRLVHQFARRLDTQVRRVGATLGLTPSQVVALRELDETLTTGSLAERMSCEPSNATFVVDRLEDAGLVSRRSSATDRRVKLVELTRDGRAMRRRVLTELDATSPLSVIPAADQEALTRLLAALNSEQVDDLA